MVPPVQTRATPPRTPYEAAVHAIWSDVLGRSGFGVHDDFFELGGHSLLAPRIVARIRKTLGVQIPVRAFFGCHTVAGLAAVVASHAAAQPRVVQRRPPEAESVLSFDQQRLWLENQLLPSVAYNVHGRRRLRGPLDVAAFEASVRAILVRHESLRTRFPLVDGRPVQIVDDLPDGWRLDLHDLSTLDGDREAAARRLADEQATTPFTLGTGPLFRCMVIRLGDEEHILSVTAHHIVCDDWSVGLFVRELSALYEAGGDVARAGLPELPIQYRDYAAWQRERLSGDELEQAVGYWRRHLAGAPAGLTMPAAHRRVESRRSGDQVHTALSEDETAALHVLCRQHGVSPFMVLFAALATVLGRWSGQRDLVIGVPIAGRTDAGTDTLIGFLVNTLPIRIDLSGTPSFAELLTRVRQACLDGYAHSDAPLDVLVEQLEVVRDPRRSPLFEVILNVISSSGIEQLRGLAVESMDPPAAMPSKFDLALNVLEADRRLLLQLDFNPERFAAPLMRTFLDHLGRLVRAAIVDTDRGILDFELGPDPKPVPAEPAAVNARAAAPADRVAVVGADGPRTYGWLRAATALAARRIPAQEHVGVVRRPVSGFVATVLGCLRAGVPYSVLDADNTVPLSYLGVTTAVDVADDWAEPDGDLPDSAPDVAGLLDGGWAADRFGFTAEDRFAVLSDRPGLLAAAMACAFTAGGTLYLPPPSATGDLDAWLRDNGITVAFLSGPRLRGLSGPLPALRYAFVDNDGELISHDVEALRGLAPGSRFVGLYRADRDGRPRALYEPPPGWRLATAPLRVPLGRELPGAPARLAHPGGQPASVGEVAELCFDGQHTGDLGRRWPDGTLELVGRMGADPTADPVETVAELRDLPDVTDAYVTEHVDADGNPTLVAYIAGPESTEPVAAVRQRLLVRLPDHLVPRQVFRLGALPRTSAGEYDLSALPVPDGDEGEDTYVAPRTPIERRLTEIFEELLDVPRIGVHDTFFELNGFSLLATQLAARIRETFDVDLPLRDVFGAPTVEGLAQLILRTQSEMSGTDDVEKLLAEIESQR